MNDSEKTAPGRSHEQSTSDAMKIAPGLAVLALLLRDPNVTRVAARLNISQPTISRSMRRTEEIARVPLFEKRGRSIVLTSKGVALAAAAENALAAVTDAVQGLGIAQHGMPGDESRPLVLGSLHSLAATVATELMSSFRSSHGDIRIDLREGPSEMLLRELDAGSIDLAVVAPRPARKFGWLPLGFQQMVLSVPSSHRFASESPVDLRRAAGERFVALGRSFSARGLADELTAAAGFEPRIEMEADDLRAVRGFVAEGYGIAILPYDDAVDPRTRSVAIASASARRVVGVAWTSRISTRAQSVRAHAEILEARYPGWGNLELGNG